MSSGGGGGLPNQPMARPSSPNVGRTNIDAETFDNIINQPSNGASRFLSGPLQMADMMPPPQSGGFGGGVAPGDIRMEDIMNAINGGNFGGRGAIGGAGGGRGFGSGNGLLGNQVSLPQMGGGQQFGGLDQGLLNPTYSPPDIMGGFYGGMR